MARATVYGDDPAAQAMIFAEQGAAFLHVVDLDGAFAGESVNGEPVRAIVERFRATFSWAAVSGRARAWSGGSIWAFHAS